MRIVDNTVILVRNPWYRRLAYLLAALIAAVLIFFPRPYLARAKIVPQDTGATAASTTALLGQLGPGTQGIGSLLSGGRPSNDLYLVIGRSDSVAKDVIKRLKLVGPGQMFPTERKARLWLDKKIDIHLLLGGVMEIEAKLYDPALAEKLTAAYARAISDSLASFGEQLINNKRALVEERFRDATQRVASAEAAIDSFRRRNNLAEPEAQFGAALSKRTDLEGQIQAKQLELRSLSQFRGPESNELAAARNELAGLRAQLARTIAPGEGAAGPNLAALTNVQFRYLALYRDLRFQQGIYDIYRRSSEQIAVEEMAAESASYIQVIDPAGLSPDRQYNVWAIASLALIVLMALFTEWYGPATGLFRRPARVESRTVEVQA